MFSTSRINKTVVRFLRIMGVSVEHSLHIFLFANVSRKYVNIYKASLLCTMWKWWFLKQKLLKKSIMLKKQLT